MRGAIDNWPPPAVTLGSGLPPAFLAGSLVRDLLESFDLVLAPAVLTLDDLAAYLDLRYSPDDYLVWVGSWLSSVVDRRWPADRVRAHVPDLREALLHRGTLNGIRAGVRACTGLEPEVRDNGGVSWSNRPGGSLPGQPGPPRLRVRVPLDPGAQLGPESDEALRTLVRAMVDDLKPAHVMVELVFG